MLTGQTLPGSVRLNPKRTFCKNQSDSTTPKNLTALLADDDAGISSYATGTHTLTFFTVVEVAPDHFGQGPAHELQRINPAKEIEENGISCLEFGVLGTSRAKRLWSW
jgi:hypothetical protein